MTPVQKPVGFGASAVLAALLWLLACLPALAQPDFPALTGRVVDQARLLSDAKEAELTAVLAKLEEDTGDQVVVVTVNSLQDYAIEDYGYQLGRAWGIGQQENDGGVLLIVAPTERKVRIEVGYGLEPILTDALSALIIHNQILPAFRVGGYERGITEGVQAIDAQLRLDPAEAQARAAAAQAAPADFPIGPALVVGVVFFLLFLALIGATVGGKGRRRASGDAAGILLWIAAEALKSGSSGRGGGFGGGGFGGGGFRGGGGSFGGGGASGGW
ncbi:TPM domain-containing protein [Brevundimonas vitis]|uniref:TPM domain-containing protein n=1 Tax=Brevundimonas vitisensis TaxID=2800818 RepID=A0ABX7BMQ3_9CAUL|nr:TPM domain-containing protein [Brevundimonas vitisensis]